VRLFPHPLGNTCSFTNSVMAAQLQGEVACEFRTTELAVGAVVHTDGSVKAVDFHKDGDLCVAGTEHGSVYITDVTRRVYTYMHERR
jgi:hypothetical protein